ncbi:MAG: dodecin domain-containing protein [Candidatus Eremiobacteraeota bacterium]|nr:dodecin domain-containing protein [Candidatus Eremiobacteraeota bacterium]
MSVYKMTEIVGVSSESFADAIEKAIAEATKAVGRMSWFEVAEQRGTIEMGQIREYQVKLHVGFRISD